MMFEYAFNLMEECAMIRKAVNASLEEEIVNVDISVEKLSSTFVVGDWIANYIDFL